MQQPTCTNVRIRSTNDAHKIFRAVQLGYLQMVTRRLDADERLALRSGCIYAWEERGPHSEITGLGIERFTEGRRWSPSRVRDEFLFYYEKYSPPHDATHLGNPTERQPPRDWDPLVKQTYSVWVDTEKGRRKWHLTAYFTQATFDQLGTIDDLPRVRDAVVPEGTFKSTRVGKSRSKADSDHSRTENTRSSSNSLNSRTFAAFPSPYPYQQQNGSPSMNPVLMHEPYQATSQTTYHDGSSHSPTYQPSPSPISPQIQGQFFPQQTPYGAPSPPSGYVDTRYPVSPNSMSPSPPATFTNPYQLPSMHASDDLRLTQPYSASRSTSASWNNNPYRSSDPHLHQSSHMGPSASFPPNVSYGSPQSPPTMHNNPQHAYSSHTSIHSSNPGSTGPLYIPSYSLQSALTPNHTTLPDTRTTQALSPLHIPDRLHLPPYSHTSLETTAEDDDGQHLAPLDELKRPARYRRDPQDEKALRLLRPPPTTP